MYVIVNSKSVMVYLYRSKVMLADWSILSLLVFHEHYVFGGQPISVG